MAAGELEVLLVIGKCVVDRGVEVESTNING